MGSFSAVCVCVCFISEQYRLRSFCFPAASHVWNEASCFEMLNSQPVHCRTVRQNSHTPSTYSLAFSLSLLPFLAFLSHFAPCIKMGASAVSPDRRSLQQVVCKREDINTMWENLLPILPAKMHFKKKHLCHHTKTSSIKSRLWTMNHFNLTKQMLTVWFEWRDLAVRQRVKWGLSACIQQPHSHWGTLIPNHVGAGDNERPFRLCWKGDVQFYTSGLLAKH